MPSRKSSSIDAASDTVVLSARPLPVPRAIAAAPRSFSYIDVVTIHVQDMNVDDRLNAGLAVYGENTPEKQQFIAFVTGDTMARVLLSQRACHSHKSSIARVRTLRRCQVSS
jgi:hypothetical protein